MKLDPITALAWSLIFIFSGALWALALLWFL